MSLVALAAGSPQQRLSTKVGALTGNDVASIVGAWLRHRGSNDLRKLLEDIQHTEVCDHNRIECTPIHIGMLRHWVGF